MFTLEEIATQRLNIPVDGIVDGAVFKDAGETGKVHRNNTFTSASNPFNVMQTTSTFKGSSASTVIHCHTLDQAMHHVRANINTPLAPEVYLGHENSEDTSNSFEIGTYFAYTQKIKPTINNLREEAKALLETRNNNGTNTYYLTAAFIETYGTHFISEVTVGAYYAAEKVQQNTDSSFLARLSFLFGGAGAGVNSSTAVQYSSCEVIGIPDASIHGLSPKEKIARFADKTTEISQQRNTNQAFPCLTFKFSSWRECGILIQSAPAIIVDNNMQNLPHFKKIVDRVEGLEESHFIFHDLNFAGAANELMNLHAVTQRIKDKMENIFFSPFAFPFALAILRIPNNVGLNFIDTHLPENSFKEILKDLSVNGVVNISPCEGGMKLMMDRTHKGFVRPPIFPENPQNGASWRLTPVKNDCYFLIDNLRWPYAYLSIKMMGYDSVCPGHPNIILEKVKARPMLIKLMLILLYG